MLNTTTKGKKLLFEEGN